MCDDVTAAPSNKRKAAEEDGDMNGGECGPPAAAAEEPAKKKLAMADLLEARLKASRAALQKEKSSVADSMETLRSASSKAPQILGGLSTDVFVPIDEESAGRREAAFGIVEFLGSHEGFRGAVKRRNCDFLVRELDPGGRVVELTSVDVPKIKDAAAGGGAGPQDEAREEEELDRLFGGRWKEVVANFGPDGEGKEMRFPVGDKSKEERVKMHMAVKALETPTMGLNSNTVDGEDGGDDGGGSKKLLAVSRRDPRARPEGRRDNWPTGQPKFLHFVLFSEGFDTLTAVGRISKSLRVPPRIFSYAGTKDRSAVVVQRVSAQHVLAEKMAKEVNQLNPGRVFTRVVVGNFEYADEPIRLGDTRGNRFNIVVRDLEGDPGPGLKAINETGFINYFGLQRFGTTTVPTSAIGKALFANDFKGAVDLLLRPRDGKEEPEMTAMRKLWSESHNASRALALLPKVGKFTYRAEYQVLDRLRKDRGNFQAALGGIPRNLRQMYCHAYQSLIWNRTVSRRIKEHGLAVLPGDLVFVDPATAALARGDCDGADDDEDGGEPKSESAAKPKAVEDNAEHRANMRNARLAEKKKEKEEKKEKQKTGETGNDAADGDKDKDKDEEPAAPGKASRKTWVRHLSVEEAASGSFHISSVVVPIPGFDVAYPDNETKTYMDALLKKDGFSLELFQSPERNKFVHSPGDYRNVVERARDLAWHTKRYVDLCEPLVETDLQRLAGKIGLELPRGGGETKKKGDEGKKEGGDEVKEKEAEREKDALIVEFSLPSSTYATMALREAMRLSSAVATTKRN